MKKGQKVDHSDDLLYIKFKSKRNRHKHNAAQYKMDQVKKFVEYVHAQSIKIKKRVLEVLDENYSASLSLEANENRFKNRLPKFRNGLKLVHNLDNEMNALHGWIARCYQYDAQVLTMFIDNEKGPDILKVIKKWDESAAKVLAKRKEIEKILDKLTQLTATVEVDIKNNLN